jgi:cytochrome P450
MVVVVVVVAIAIVVPLLYLVLLPPARRGGGDGARRSLPPSPRGLPLLGHLHLLGALPHRALRSLAAAHGPVLLLRLGRVPVVVVSSAAAAEEVMRARDVAFASRPRVAMAERLLYGGRDVAFAPYGEYWRQARRICVVHLLSARRVLSFRRVREEEAAALVARVRAAAGGAVDLVEHLTAYSNTVVSRAVFGDESARGLYGDVDRGRALRKLFDDFVELLGQEPMGELLPWLGWVDAVRGLDGKVQRTFEALDSIIEKVIDDHRRRRRRREVGRQMDSDDDGGGGGDHRDFVDVLLDVNETDKDAGIRLGTIEIKAIILVWNYGLSTIVSLKHIYAIMHPPIYLICFWRRRGRGTRAGHVRGGHGHHDDGDGMGHGRADHPPERNAQGAGRDQGGRRRHRMRHGGPH